MARTLTEQQYEQLSAYIDGQLSEAERLQLEQQLNTDDDLREELQSLQQTVALIQQMPLLKSPRNFTITAEMVNESPKIISLPNRQQRVISILSGIAAIFFVVFGFLLLYTEFSSNTLSEATLLDNQVSNSQQVASAPTQPTVLVTEEAPSLQQSQSGVIDTFEQDSENEAFQQTDSEDLAMAEAEIAQDTPSEPVESDSDMAAEEELSQIGESTAEEMLRDTSDSVMESTEDMEFQQELEESADTANDDFNEASGAGATLFTFPSAPQNAPAPSISAPTGADFDDVASTIPSDGIDGRTDNNLTQVFSSEPAPAPNANRIEPTITGQNNNLGALYGVQGTSEVADSADQLGDEVFGREFATTIQPETETLIEPRLQVEEVETEQNSQLEKSTTIEESPSLLILALGAILIFIGGVILVTTLRKFV